MKRLLYVEALGVSGGMGGYNDSVVAAYAATGVSVGVVTTSASDTLRRAANVTISRAYSIALDRSRRKVSRGIAYGRAAASILLRSRGYDTVVFHFLHWPVIDAFVLASLRLLGKHVVLIAHDPLPIATGSAGPAYRFCLRLPSLVVAHGAHAEDTLLKLHVSRQRIVRTGFGDYEPPQERPRSHDLRTLGLDALEGPVAAIVGNLKPGKGIRRAIAALDASDTPIRTLIVAGQVQGRWDSTPLTAERRHVRVLRIDRRMTEGEELAVYRLSNVVLALYEWGYSSGVIARAHSVRRPVVMTDVGDLAEQRAAPDVVLDPGYADEDLRAAVRQAAAAPTSTLTTNRAPWTSQVAAVVDRLQ